MEVEKAAGTSLVNDIAYQSYCLATGPKFKDSFGNIIIRAASQVLEGQLQRRHAPLNRVALGEQPEAEGANGAWRLRGRVARSAGEGEVGAVRAVALESDIGESDKRLDGERGVEENVSERLAELGVVVATGVVQVLPNDEAVWREGVDVVDAVCKKE
jgi:hypothetical protein